MNNMYPFCVRILKINIRGEKNYSFENLSLSRIYVSAFYFKIKKPKDFRHFLTFANTFFFKKARSIQTALMLLTVVKWKTVKNFRQMSQVFPATCEQEGKLFCGLQLSSRVSWLAPLVSEEAPALPAPPRTEVVSDWLSSRPLATDWLSSRLLLRPERRLPVETASGCRSPKHKNQSVKTQPKKCTLLPGC